MEETDRQIVDMLKDDGRMSFADLARATGLSTSAVHQRVRKLQERDVIRGYRAIVDPTADGRPLSAFLFLTPVGAVEVADVAERLDDLGDISACYAVAGDESYLLTVRVRDVLALEGLAREIRQRTGMATRTQVVLDTKFER
ncbi:MAG: Lrp/AsnC family transcriptional regulator [Actinobacteria bacterium]|nr:MAG: Lrp/AsnC family transcriptional regulator [Actinomycetota bacterium]